MKCSKCGFENIDNAKYCINCGSRLDGQIQCPKCGHFSMPNAEACESCGYKFPHEEKTSSNNNAYKDSVNKVDKVISQVFTILILIFFSLSLLMSFSKLVDVNHADSINVDSQFGFSHFYLVNNWINFANFVSSLDVSEYTNVEYAQLIINNLIPTLIPFLIVLANIVCSYFFSIKGIVKSIQDLMNKSCSLKRSYQAMIIVLFANVMTLSLLKHITNTWYADGEISYQLITNELFEKYINLGSTIVLCITSFEVFKAFDKRSVTMFVEKLLSFLGLLLAFSIIDNLKTASFIITSGTSVVECNLSNLVFNYIISFFTRSPSNSEIAEAILSSGSTIYSIVLYVASFAYAVIFGYGFFNENYKAKRYKVPLFAASIVIAFAALFSLITDLGFLVLVMNEDTYTVSLGQSAITNFVNSLFLVSFSIFTFKVFRLEKQRQKLQEQVSR